MSLISLGFKCAFLPLSFVALALSTGNLKAQAEDPNSVDAIPVESTVSIPTIPQNSTVSSPQSKAPRQIANRVTEPIPGEAATVANQLGTAETSVRTQDKAKIATEATTSTAPTAIGSTPNQGNAPQVTTAPGSAMPTMSVPLNAESATTPAASTTPDATNQPNVSPTAIERTTAQLSDVDPGRATRSGSSYVGIGGNIGIGSGDTQLGQGSFAVLSKIGLLPSFSVRPSVLFSDDVTILIPITYDFSFGQGPTSTLGFSAAPFVGVGAAISTGDGADVGLLLTGGVDVPLSSQFTATASVNASVTGEAAVGILLGVGYNFQGF